MRNIMRAVFVRRFIDKREQIAVSLALKSSVTLIFDDFLPKAHTLHLCVSVIAQRNNEVLKTRPKLTRVSLSCRASLLPVFRWWSQTDRRRCERCTSGREASTHQGARVELLPTTVVWPSQKTLSQHHSMTSTPLSLCFNTWAPVTSRLTRAHVTKQDVSQHISLQDWAVKKEERHHVLVRFTATLHREDNGKHTLDGTAPAAASLQHLCAVREQTIIMRRWETIPLNCPWLLPTEVITSQRKNTAMLIVNRRVNQRCSMFNADIKREGQSMACM